VNRVPHTITIIGAGVGGLTLALALERAGISCRIYESAAEIRPVGVGINVLPHATRELFALGVGEALERAGVATKEAAFFNRFGQLIHREPLGRAAGYETPQISIHRADLQRVLLETVYERLGRDAVVLGAVCTGASDDERGATAHFADGSSVHASAVIACDGIHSVIRKQFYPAEGEPRYSGVNMWRGVTRTKPMLSGATMVRAGWLTHGKLVIYPIRDDIDGRGMQLINWVAEIETPVYKKRRDWNRPGNLDDFLPHYADWHFDWLDVPALLREADFILEFPMVDQEPLPRWTHGHITLLGDAAHPMVPRGSNGAGQSILDTRALTDALLAHDDTATALRVYEEKRLEPTARIVRTNHVAPPDAIIGEVMRRTGDQPFTDIDAVISHEEILAITDGYKKVAGYDHASLRS
jgi:2-polyprenyl-6-methoxyphenol hydroxylase-like FAD-dependent oxidoreductase